MSSEQTVEITTQPCQLSREDALDQVRNRALAKIKTAVKEIEPTRVVRRYKPFYSYDVMLTKPVFRGEDDVTEGTIVVDAMTDIARPFTSEAVNEKIKQVSTGEIIDPELSPDEALVTANSRRMQVEHRERGSIDIDDDPTLVYKPVWIVEMSNGDVRVVDGVEGDVLSNMIVR
mgnify:CR=1 FL=1|jgi:hypothetical protein